MTEEQWQQLPPADVERERVKLYCGDCVEVLAKLPDGCVDLVVTDPPYNVGMKYGDHDDNMALADFEDWVRVWLADCRRVATTVLVSTGVERLAQYARVEPWRWLLAWHKSAAMGRSVVGFNNWEPVAVWGKGSSAGRTDYVYAPIETREDTGDHPCPKPVKWASGQLACWPNAKSVLDPFTGSGTTGVACAATEEENVRFIGIEREPRFIELAAKRIDAELAQPKLFSQEIVQTEMFGE